MGGICERPPPQIIQYAGQALPFTGQRPRSRLMSSGSHISPPCHSTGRTKAPAHSPRAQVRTRADTRVDGLGRQPIARAATSSTRLIDAAVAWPTAETRTSAPRRAVRWQQQCTGLRVWVAAIAPVILSESGWWPALYPNPDTTSRISGLGRRGLSQGCAVPGCQCRFT